MTDTATSDGAPSAPDVPPQPDAEPDVPPAPDDVPDAPVDRTPPPIPVTVRKRERTRLAKAELWAMVAEHAADLATDVVTDELETARLEPLRAMCVRYALTPADLGRLAGEVATELQGRARHAGYDQAWR
jgi:hypothetical protein